jgi:hypothetical protein
MRHDLTPRRAGGRPTPDQLFEAPAIRSGAMIGGVARKGRTAIAPPKTKMQAYERI